MKEIIEELREYAELEGSELGDSCEMLILIYQSYSECFSDEFLCAMEKEIRFQLQYFKDNSKIIEITEVSPQKEWISKDLEWKEQD